MIESFLSTDDDHGDGIGTPLSTLKRRSTACSENDHKGIYLLADEPRKWCPSDCTSAPS